MRKRQKIMSLLLALCLVVGLLPGLTVTAQAAGTDKNIMAGVSGISGPEKKDDGSGNYYTPSDYIYFGVNGSDPIKWRVLSTSGNATGNSDSLSDGTNTVNNSDALFLLSEYLLGSNVYFQQNYHGDNGSYYYYKGSNHNANIAEALANAWQGSDAQTWAKDFAGESGSSVGDAFSSGEQAALLATTKEDAATQKYSINWGASKLEGDKVFFLSADELAQYVGSYDQAPGLTATPAGSPSAGVWWLRSPDNGISASAGVVDVHGFVVSDGVTYGWAVRPAFNLNLTSVLFTSAAEGGKSSMTSGLQKVTDYTDSGTKGWKVTLAESDKSIKDTDSGIKNAQGNAVENLELTAGYSASQSLTVTHKSLSSISNDYTNITATLTNGSGEIFYYGSINTNASETTSTVIIPTGLAAGDYTLSIYGEDWNVDKQTDYATSDAITAKITVKEQNYTVTVEGSEAQTTGAGSYAQGATVQIDAGTKSGYTFAGWTNEDGVVFANAKSAQTTFTMLGKAVTVIATWTANSGGYSAPTYSITLPKQTPGGKVTSSPRYAEQGNRVTLTATPDEGYRLDSLTVKDSRDNLIELTDRGEGKYTFTMPGRNVTVEAKFSKIEETPAPWRNPFADVSEGEWYYDAVKYVCQNGLMNGTSATTFSPGQTTSRAMIATILWRQAGSPAVNYAMRFDDVDPNAYYGEAVRWAASEGIVSGYGNGKFGPNDPITREQLAAMLYNYEKKQGGGFNGAWAFRLDFDDVASVSEWAYEPMSWMVMNGVISGTSSTTLSPNGQATRAQAATMLMRYLEAAGA